MHINFCTLLIKQSCLKLHKLFHNSRVSFRSHYETLKLERNCNLKEIREAFIKLSKKNHPDVNKNPKAHTEFLKIQEAYNVLSKPESRRNYDLGLAKPFHTVHNTTNIHSTPWEDHQRGRKNPWDDPLFYHNRDRSRDSYYEQQPYYGIRGVDKVSNGTIATLLIIMAFFSFIGQMLAINYSFNAQKEKMRRRSDSTQETLNEIRERANRNGNELQLEIMRQRFEEAERERQRLKKLQIK